MTARFSYHPWTVEELVSGVDKGTIRLPDIQRPFVWPNSKVRDLVDSMYRGYPVGELMFWQNQDTTHTKAIGDDSAKTQQASLQVVDGQQRLTSLYAVVKGLRVWRNDYTREQVIIAFNPLTKRFEVPNAATKHSVEWIADITSVFASAFDAEDKYIEELRKDPKYQFDRSLKRRIRTAIANVEALKRYEFTAVQIKEDVQRETVADIFVRINSEGVTLSAADFILTWLSVFWEDGRAQLETWSRNSRFTPAGLATALDEKVQWTAINPYLKFEPGQILRVAVAVGLRRARLQDAYNYLRGRDPRTRSIHPEAREKALAELQVGQEHALRPLHWDEFLKVMERAGFRTSEMVTSNITILYVYALWIIGRVEFKVPIDELRELMARWFFMAQITGRYTGSAETRMQQDLNRLDGLHKTPSEFAKVLNTQIDAAVPPDWWNVTLVNALTTSSAAAPAYVAYIAALNILDADVLLATSKVKDWINPNRRSVKGIEKHHLFPRDYLTSTLGIKDVKHVNQVANYAMVEWSDNIDISNEAPTTYWPAQVAKKKIESARLIRQEQWHALPEGWTAMSYDEFLTARRKIIARVIREGFLRLGDPNYEPDLGHLVAAQVTPLLGLPSFEELVMAGVIPAGTILTPLDPERQTEAEVTEDGLIKVGEHICEDLDRAAKEDGADTGSGWDYWAANLTGTTEPAPVALLRTRPIIDSSHVGDDGP